MSEAIWNTLNNEDLKNQAEQSAETPEEVRAETLRLLKEAQGIISKAEGTEKYGDFKEEYDEMMQEMSIALQDGIIDEKELGKLRNEIIDVREGEDIYAIERAAMKAKEKVKNGIINSLTAGIEKFNTLGSDEILPKLSYFTDFIGFFSNKENKQDIEKKLIAFQNNMKNSSLSEAWKLLKISQFIFDIWVDNSGLSSSILWKFIETANNNVQENIIESIKQDPSQPLIIWFSRDKWWNYIQSRADFEQEIQNTNITELNSTALANYFLHIEATGNLNFDSLIDTFWYKKLQILWEIWEKKPNAKAKEILIRNGMSWLIMQAEMYDDITILLKEDFDNIIIEEEVKKELGTILRELKEGKITSEKQKRYHDIKTRLQEESTTFTQELLGKKIKRNPTLLNDKYIYENLITDTEKQELIKFFTTKEDRISLLYVITNTDFIHQIFESVSTNNEAQQIYTALWKEMQSDIKILQNRYLLQEDFLDILPLEIFQKENTRNYLEEKILKNFKSKTYIESILSQFPDKIERTEDFLETYKGRHHLDNKDLPQWYMKVKKPELINEVISKISLTSYLESQEKQIKITWKGPWIKKYIQEKWWEKIAQSPEDKKTFLGALWKDISLWDLRWLNDKKDLVIECLKKHPLDIKYINTTLKKDSDVINIWAKNAQVSDIPFIRYFDIDTITELEYIISCLPKEIQPVSYSNKQVSVLFHQIEHTKTKDDQSFIEKFYDTERKMQEFYQAVLSSTTLNFSEEKNKTLQDTYNIEKTDLENLKEIYKNLQENWATYLKSQYAELFSILWSDENIQNFFKDIQKEENTKLQHDKEKIKLDETTKYNAEEGEVNWTLLEKDFQEYKKKKLQEEKIPDSKTIIDEFITNLNIQNADDRDKIKSILTKLQKNKDISAYTTDTAIQMAKWEISLKEFENFQKSYEIYSLFSRQEAEEILQKQWLPTQKEYPELVQKNSTQERSQEVSHIIPEISHYTQTESGYTITSTSWETIEGVTPEEFKEIQKSPEALKNFIDFKEICEDPTLNIQFIWEYREQFLHTYKLVTGDTIGVDTKDGDMLSKTEVKKLLDFIANTTNSENIASTNFSDAARRIRDINGNSLDGGGKDSFGEGRILQTWKQKWFFDRNSMFKFQIEKIKQQT